jgi:hypothetical protein
MNVSTEENAFEENNFEMVETEDNSKIVHPRGPKRDLSETRGPKSFLEKIPTQERDRIKKSAIFNGDSAISIGKLIAVAYPQSKDPTQIAKKLLKKLNRAPASIAPLLLTNGYEFPDDSLYYMLFRLRANPNEPEKLWSTITSATFNCRRLIIVLLYIDKEIHIRQINHLQ